MTARASAFLVALMAAAFVHPCPGQVLSWGVAKGACVEQTADNTPPVGVTGWFMNVWIDLASPTDAAYATLSGGGISGAIRLWKNQAQFEYDRSFTTQAAMNARFPSSASYTLTIGGGTLGTRSQTFILPAEAYPRDPYFTGNSWSALRALDVTAAHNISWVNPGTHRGLAAAKEWPRLAALGATRATRPR